MPYNEREFRIIATYYSGKKYVGQWKNITPLLSAKILLHYNKRWLHGKTCNKTERAERREGTITDGSRHCTALGVSRSTIAGYETKGREPDVHMLITMADFYDVSMDYLVGRKDEK